MQDSKDFLKSFNILSLFKRDLPKIDNIKVPNEIMPKSVEYTMEVKTN